MSPDSMAERNPIDRLAEEFAERLRKGERPSLSDYVRHYPELADDIRELFPALMMMEQLKPTLADAASQRPERIGDYRLLREIGRGGMGVVYEAEQLSLGRHVALKVFPADSRTHPAYLERFRREAKAAARLHHTNIVPVFGVGEDGGVHYYAMQFIHGEGLDKVLHDLRRLRGGQQGRAGGEGSLDAVPSASVAASLLSGRFELTAMWGSRSATAGPLPPRVDCTPSGTLSGAESEAAYCRGVAHVGLQVAEGLAYAHKQGILHRDIKPSNLLVDLQGTAWITDFGLAKAEDADELTASGDIVGTIRYMAPERFEGASLPQSDVYALGMTLYEMLTLRPAFDESNRARLIQRILQESPPAPRQLDPRIPRDLETVVLKAIAHDPGRRYTTAGDLAEDLRRFLADRPVRARRSRLPERLWRWCRRNPAVASLAAVIALLLLVVAAGSLLSAWSLRGAERQTREKLWRAKLDEARATVRSGLPGQRFTSLRRIREARAIAEELGLAEEDRLQLRNAAIAALALPDFEAVEEDGSAAADFDFRPEYYACVERNGRISVRRVGDDRETAALPETDRPISLRLSPDGRHLAFCPDADQANGMLRLWRLNPAGPRCVHEGVSLSSQYADFSPDGERLVYESINCLTVVEVATGRARSWPLPGTYRGGGVRCRPGGRDVAVGRVVNGKGILEVRELATGAVRQRLGHDDSCTSYDWHPGGRFLAVAHEIPKPVISLWDVEAGRRILTFAGHKHDGVIVRFNRAGDRLISTDWSGAIRFWDADNGHQLHGLLAPTQPAAFSSNGKYLACLTSVGGDTKRQVFRSAMGREVRALARVSGTGGTSYLWPTFSGDGRLLAVLVADSCPLRPRGLSLLAWPTGRELGHLPAADHAPLGFDRDGALWTGRNGTNVFRWPRSTDAVNGVVRLGPPELVFSVPGAVARALSPDGQMLVLSNGYRGALLLRGGPSGHLLPTGSQEDVRYAAVNSDGRWVASGSHWCSRGAAAAKVWDVRTGRLVKEFVVPGQCAVGFSPDDRWFVTDGGGVRLWRAGSWEEGPQVFADGDAGGWIFSPNGRLLVLGGHGRVRLVRPDSGVEVARLALAEQTLYRPQCFAPGGELLVRGEDTEALHVWDLQRIRRQLAEMGLDWSDSPAEDGPFPTGPPADGALDPSPPAVEFVGADLATDPQKMR